MLLRLVWLLKILRTERASRVPLVPLMDKGREVKEFKGSW